MTQRIVVHEGDIEVLAKRDTGGSVVVRVHTEHADVEYVLSLKEAYRLAGDVAWAADTLGSGR